MIFTDDLENVAEPNQNDAHQNLHSPTRCARAILTIFKESSEDDSTNKRFQLFHLLFFAFLGFWAIVFLFGEAEAGSAEEQPAKE
jgi:hypothetical protein